MNNTIIFDTSKNSATSTNNTNDTEYNFLGLESENAIALKKLIYQLALKTMDKACLDVLTNGFSYEQVADIYYEIEEENNKKGSIKRERLGDLRKVMYTLPIQTLDYVESFVSMTDIIARCFFETNSEHITKGSNSYIYNNEISGKRMVYYGFVFSGYETNIQKNNIDNNNAHHITQDKIYINPPECRRELLGIQPLQKRIEPSTNKIEYIGSLKNKQVVFHEDLVITTEYATYHELYQSLFGLHANLLQNMSHKIETSKFIHVTAPDEYFNLKPSEKSIYTEAFQKIVNGKNGGIITTSGYNINLQTTSYSGTLEKTGVDLLTNSIGFVTGIPQSILFGMQQTGWSAGNEIDQLKYEFFLKMIAENFFLPIMQQFCKICKLEDYKKLEYKTDALIREKLQIFSTIVPEQLKTEERLFYIGLEVDKLLGIDSKAKAEIKKQLGVEKDSEEGIKKKSDNSKEDIKKKSDNSKNSK